MKKPMDQVRKAFELREPYTELCEFFRSCGGSYRNMHPSSCWNIIDALANNRCIIHREDSQIVRALVYWRIRPEDVSMVRNGYRPQDVENGSIIYLAEHAGVDGNRGLYQLIRELKKKYQGDACWHERWKAPDQFRYYRRERYGRRS